MTVTEPVTGNVDVCFGELLRRERARHGLTQQHLADLSTISVRAIRDLENGRARRPRPETVRLIGDALRLGRLGRLGLEQAAGRFRPAVAPDYPAALAEPPLAAVPAIGRDTQAAELTALLTTGESRLVTLTGLAGVGKTCLAREVAARLHEAGLPVLWLSGGVPVESLIRDDGLRALVGGCAAELVDPGPGAPQALVDLADLVGDRPTLLVLDGVDGVDGAGPRPDRIVRLISLAPGLRVLSTSTRAGVVPDERTFLLEPAEVPELGAVCGRGPAEMDDWPGLAVFSEHARRARPGFHVGGADGGALTRVTEICRRLDGLPAALEAAATWLAVYDLDSLAEALGGDAAALFDHLEGAGRGPVDVAGRLGQCVRALPRAEGDLLEKMCAAGGDVDLDDVVQLTGRGRPECGRLVRGLLLAGVLRTATGPGRTRYRVLNLVRALIGAAGTAAMPRTPRMSPA